MMLYSAVLKELTRFGRHSYTVSGTKISWSYSWRHVSAQAQGGTVYLHLGPASTSMRNTCWYQVNLKNKQMNLSCDTYHIRVYDTSTGMK